MISRAWFEEDLEETAPAEVSTKGPWNGEYYVSFGKEEGRSLDDARKYGFISAGGGPWYTKTLSLLSPGDRVWVNIPHTGYVGVGKLKRSAVLLFYHDPSVVQNGSVVKVGRFEKDIGLHYDDLLEESLIVTASKIVDLIYLKYLKAKITFEHDRRQETYPFARAAVREAVYNAYCGTQRQLMRSKTAAVRRQRHTSFRKTLCRERLFT